MERELNQLTDEELEQFRAAQGYRAIRRLPDGSIAILQDLMFTRAILLGSTRMQSFTKRFCFEQRSWADREFEALQSQHDEPEGWTARR